MLRCGNSNPLLTFGAPTVRAPPSDWPAITVDRFGHAPFLVDQRPVATRAALIDEFGFGLHGSFHHLALEFQRALGKDTITIPFRWLRAAPSKKSQVIHCVRGVMTPVLTNSSSPSTVKLCCRCNKVFLVSAPTHAGRYALARPGKIAGGECHGSLPANGIEGICLLLNSNQGRCQARDSLAASVPARASTLMLLSARSVRRSSVSFSSSNVSCKSPEASS